MPDPRHPHHTERVFELAEFSLDAPSVSEGKGACFPLLMRARAKLYRGAYEIGGEEDLAVRRGIEEAAPPPEVAVPPGEGWFGAGGGWSARREQLVSRLGPALRGCDPTLLTSAYIAAKRQRERAHMYAMILDVISI